MKKAITTLFVTVLVGLVGPHVLASTARRPANDDLEAAQAVESLPFETSVDLRGATLEENEIRPSCRRIRSSVWYSFTVPEAGAVIAELAGPASSALAIFEAGTETAPAAEVACTSPLDGGALEFEAAPERAYLLQVGSGAKQGGVVDLTLRLSPWKEVSLAERSFEPASDEQYVPVLHLKGGPLPDDPSMYEITARASQQDPVTASVLTFGLVKQTFEVNLLKIPASATRVRVEITGRYDSSQYHCAAALGSVCLADSPLEDPRWLSGGDGHRAELVVTVFAERNGDVLVERSQAIPYAGQVLGLVP